MIEEGYQFWEIGIFADTQEGSGEADKPGRPDLMMHYGAVPFDMHTLRQGYPTSENAFVLTPNVTHSKSRGTVKLRSRITATSRWWIRATSATQRATTCASPSPASASRADRRPACTGRMGR
ncbi:hypothetical protein [Nesterenkonia pannonica]|uniref:hypothetical protein n=1 Tax=Nesterenkonia pannonica TaxID=1548602 RepID=UPI002164E38C|nr:hypothetical protein [Nesterenkonia pannonica]